MCMLQLPQMWSTSLPTFAINPRRSALICVLPLLLLRLLLLFLLLLSPRPILNQHRERTPEAHVHHMQQEMLVLSEPTGTQEGKICPVVKSNAHLGGFA